MPARWRAAPVSRPALGREALDCRHGGERRRDVSVQNRYNVTDRTSEPVLSECERDVIAFLPWFPLSGGSDAARVSPTSRFCETESF